jgi:hypothetical protein
MAHIRTFSGDGDSLGEAIAKAEEAAQGFLTYLTADQILSVQAQTIATPWKTKVATDIKSEMVLVYLHVITVVSTASVVGAGTPSDEAAPDRVNEPPRLDYSDIPTE